MLEKLMILLIVLPPISTLARSSISTSVAKAWLVCDDIADAQAYARATSGDDQETIRREEGRLTASIDDGHPACQLLIPGAKVDIAGLKGSCDASTTSTHMGTDAIGCPRAYCAIFRQIRTSSRPEDRRQRVLPNS